MKISKAKFLKLLQVGDKLTLTHCLLGACNSPREVAEVKSYGYVMLTPEGKHSHLRLDTGDVVDYQEATGVITIIKGDKIAARYKTVDAISCNQCAMLSINGLACHETGCPNMGARWDHETSNWIRQVKCDICGYDVDYFSVCCMGNDGE
jgi:hypothetical protein